MTISRSQVWKSSGSSGLETLDVTYDTNPGAGNLLLFFCIMSQTSDITDPTTDQGDTIAESYEQNDPTPSARMALWHVLAAVGGSTTVTFNVAFGNMDCEIGEYETDTPSGSWTFDDSNSGSGTDGNPVSGNVTTVAPESLLIGTTMMIDLNSQPFTPTGSFTEEKDVAGANAGDYQIERRILSSAPVTDQSEPTPTGNTDWACGIAAYGVSAASGETSNRLAGQGILKGKGRAVAC